MNISVIVLIKLFQIVVLTHQLLDPTIISTVQSQLSKLYLSGITFEFKLVLIKNNLENLLEINFLYGARLNNA